MGSLGAERTMGGGLGLVGCGLCTHMWAWAFKVHGKGGGRCGVSLGREDFVGGVGHEVIPACELACRLGL